MIHSLKKQNSMVYFAGLPMKYYYITAFFFFAWNEMTVAVISLTDLEKCLCSRLFIQYTFSEGWALRTLANKA